MDVEETIAALLPRVRELEGEGRRLVALSGPPASGKSTLAEALVAALADAVLVPMDGFHLDNAVLEARGLLARKGAPETFDAAGFVHAIRRLRAGGEVILPVFDRSRDLSVAGAVVVAAESRIAVVEGNYLTFDASPWRDLMPLWDLSVYVDVPEAELERRLVERWLTHGLAPEAAEARARSNDLPNARRIAASRLPVDLVISQ